MLLVARPSIAFRWGSCGGISRRGCRSRRLGWLAGDGVRGSAAEVVGRWLLVGVAGGPCCPAGMGAQGLGPCLDGAGALALLVIGFFSTVLRGWRSWAGRCTRDWILYSTSRNTDVILEYRSWFVVTPSGRAVLGGERSSSFLLGARLLIRGHVPTAAAWGAVSGGGGSVLIAVPRPHAEPNADPVPQGKRWGTRVIGPVCARPNIDQGGFPVWGISRANVGAARSARNGPCDPIARPDVAGGRQSCKRYVGRQSTAVLGPATSRRFGRQSTRSRQKSCS